MLAVVDVGLPGIDGFEVCRRLRADGPLPVLFLTARDAEADRVHGLELGGDDYVVKPFSPREVVARVRAILRRGEGRDRPASVIAVSPTLELDLDRREVSSYGCPVALAGRELDVLAFLARNRGIALSRRQLLDGAWGPDWDGDERTVDVHVAAAPQEAGRRAAAHHGVGHRLPARVR